MSLFPGIGQALGMMAAGPLGARVGGAILDEREVRLQVQQYQHNLLQAQRRFDAEMGLTRQYDRDLRARLVVRGLALDAKMNVIGVTDAPLRAADWRCAYCRTSHGAETRRCPNCGAPR